jgi:outer membrane protein OmpA-like peptidoglycan-associated protein
MKLSATLRSFATILLASAATLASTSARAAESERGPTYFEAHLLGAQLSFASANGVSASGVQYPIEIHGGYHVSGRHDGFVIGATQKFAFANGSIGATVLRLGYDVAIPIGRRELTIAPYAFGGIAYPFGGGDPGAHVGAGVEGRFFPIEKIDETSAAPVVEAPKRVIVAADKVEIREKIQFRHNEAVIESASDSLLAEIAQVIKRNPQLKKLRVEGHASSEGDANANEKLSDARAKAVRQHLVERGGVAPELLESKGYGAKNPIASNDTEEGREKNRRVEIRIVEQSATVEKIEEGKVRAPSKGGEGFFVAVKPLEIGIVTGTPTVVTLAFQGGLGYAF